MTFRHRITRTGHRLLTLRTNALARWADAGSITLGETRPEGLALPEDYLAPPIFDPDDPGKSRGSGGA